MQAVGLFLVRPAERTCLELATRVTGRYPIQTRCCGTRSGVASVDGPPAVCPRAAEPACPASSHGHTARRTGGRRAVGAWIGDQRTIRTHAAARGLGAARGAISLQRVAKCRSLGSLGRPRQIVFRPAAGLRSDGNGPALSVAVACGIADQRANPLHRGVRARRHLRDRAAAGQPQGGEGDQQTGRPPRRTSKSGLHGCDISYRGAMCALSPITGCISASKTNAAVRRFSRRCRQHRPRQTERRYVPTRWCR